MLQYFFHAAVFGNELQGRLGTYPGHPGNVVGGVPHKPFQVNELQGHKAFVIFCKSFFIIQFYIGNAFLRVHDPGPVINELQLVPVPGDDIHFHGRICFFRKGANDIVRLVIVQFQGGNSHGLQHLHAQGELLFQFRRRRFALSLVIRKQFRTEGLP